MNVPPFPKAILKFRKIQCFAEHFTELNMYYVHEFEILEIHNAEIVVRSKKE